MICRQIGLSVLLGLGAQLALAQGVLENPAKGTAQSGLGVLSGWHCAANKIELVVDGGDPIPAAYGTPRDDTIGTCGDSNNGFGLLMLYSLFGPGEHEVVALADGQEFDRSTFNVTLVDDEELFKRNLSGEFVIQGFPDPGQETVVEWNEGLQTLVIKGRVPIASTPDPEGLWKSIDADNTWMVIDRSPSRNPERPLAQTLTAIIAPVVGGGNPEVLVGEYNDDLTTGVLLTSESLVAVSEYLLFMEGPFDMVLEVVNCEPKGGFFCNIFPGDEFHFTKVIP